MCRWQQRLHEACSRLDAPLVAVLLSCGADAACTDGAGCTALHALAGAAVKTHVDSLAASAILDMLLFRGAQVP